MSIKLVRDILTGKDGFTYDNGRVLGSIAILSYIIFSAYDVYVNRRFSYEHFGVGLGSLIATLGLNLKLKEGTEP